jgi:hypothetical protein
MGPLVEHLDVFPDLPPRWNRPFQLSTPGLATLELEGLSLDTGIAGYGLVGPKRAWSGKMPLGMAKGRLQGWGGAADAWIFEAELRLYAPALLWRRTRVRVALVDNNGDRWWMGVPLLKGLNLLLAEEKLVDPRPLPLPLP